MRQLFMGRIDSVISDELEKKLRIRAIEDFGGKKGSLTDALEQSIEWYVDPRIHDLIEKYLKEKKK